MSDWNSNVIEEFRENEGKVGGFFEDKPLLLLHHTGAKSGTQRVSPLLYQQLDGGLAIFASKGGAPTHPDWYYNVKANPSVTVEVGTETRDLKARIAPRDEREPIWSKVKADHPGTFDEYEKKTSRQIPVIILE